MAEIKTAVVAFLLITMLVASSVPMANAFGCQEACVQRCSNGKNLDSCNTMCKTACVPGMEAEAAKDAAEKAAGKGN